MFRPKTLLKVMSIIMIILAVLGLIGTAMTYIMIPKMGDIPGVDMSLINSALTPLNLVLSLVSSVSMLLAGIFGVAGKSMKAAAIAAGIYTVILLFNLITAIASTGFQFLQIFDLIIPVLYWWGLYQSKE